MEIKHIQSKPHAVQQSNGAYHIDVTSYRPPPSIGYLRTFNDIADSPEPRLLGQVKDIGRFTLPLCADGNSTNIDLPIKAPGTPFIIPPQYKQFLPEIEEMIDQCCQRNEGNGIYLLGVRQTLVEPDNQGRPFVDIHKDLNLSKLSCNDQLAPNSLVLIASNTLTTGFSQYKLTEEEVKALESSQTSDKDLYDMLNQRSLEFNSFPDGSITAHFAKTIHAVASPKVPTHRTVIIMVSHPVGEEISALENNPYLEEYLANSSGKRLPSTQPASP